MNSRPNNLPIPVSSFIGREREVAEVQRLLSSSRLVTLTGASGCGKTRLALKVASHALDANTDGVWLIDFTPLSDPSLVLQRLAATLEIHEQLGQPLINTLTNYLRNKHLLLLLDNCEHVIGACASYGEWLLQSCPELRIMATSREDFNISGETVFQVPTLSAPNPAQPLTSESISAYEAVQLFIARAVAANGDFALTDQNAAAVAHITYRLDGIPLAIELAAARVKGLSVAQIAARLDDRFHLLSAGTRTALPRHQSLRAAIDWTYDLLAAPARGLLRRLSVFAGAWTLEAAAEVCCDPDESDILSVLMQLVAKSLAMVEECDGEAHYRMLETIRYYAAEKLADAGELVRVRNQHLAYFLRLAEETAPKLMGAEQSHGLIVLEREHDNLRRAIDWSLESGQVLTGLRLAGALIHFWDVHDYAPEGHARLMRLLAEPAAAEQTPARVRALWGAGFLAFVQHDHEKARPLIRSALDMANALGDQPLVAQVLLNMGNVAYAEGNFADARSSYMQALAIQRTLGDRRSISFGLAHVGLVAMHDGQFQLAESLFQESLKIVADLKDKSSMSYALRRLAQAVKHQGDFGRAAELCQESLRLSLEVSSKQATIAALALVAAIQACQGRSIPAVQLFGATDALLQSTRTEFRPYDSGEYQRHIEELRTHLNAAAFNAAWAQGRALSMERAIALARRVSRVKESVPNGATPSQDYPAGLTAREVEVLRLVAIGLSNAEVATKLTVSIRTVGAHLRSIYRKLDVTGRTAAARIAIDHKLV